MGLEGLSASRKRSCATMLALRTSSTSPLRQMMRSFSRREKMSAGRGLLVGDGGVVGWWCIAYRCASRLPGKLAWWFVGRSTAAMRTYDCFRYEGHWQGRARRLLRLRIVCWREGRNGEATDGLWCARCDCGRAQCAQACSEYGIHCNCEVVFWMCSTSGLTSRP